VTATVTDRALRYRSINLIPDHPKVCAFCGARQQLMVGHVDGFEEHLEVDNLTWSCRSCNSLASNTLKNAGMGRRTHQFNPTKGGGASNVGEWLQAVGAITPHVDRGDRGLASDMKVSDAVAMIRATPHYKRSEFASKLRSSGGRRAAERWNPAMRKKNLFGFGTPKALSPRQTTPARGGIAAHMPARSKRETSETVAGSYGGYRIMKTPDGEFYSSLDPDSLFQTKKQVQSFIDWWKKGRGNPARLVMALEGETSRSIKRANPKLRGYGPDELEHVYSFARTDAEAEQIADEANRQKATRKGKFIAGSFQVSHIPGRSPAVVGRLTGNPGSEAFWFVVKSKGKLQLVRASDPVELRGQKMEGPYSSQGEAQKALTFWKANPAKFDRCVKAVKAKGGAANAYAVCTAAGTRNPAAFYLVADGRSIPVSKQWTFEEAQAKADSLNAKRMAAGKDAIYAVYVPDLKVRLGYRANPARRNPASAAVSVFEEFHGHRPDEIVEVKKKIHFHKHLAGAGILKRLVVDGIDGRSHLINGFRGALLCFNESKNQLFIESGDQAINLEDFGIKSPHELETLGKVKHIDYSTRKDHLGDEGGDAVYTHKFRTTNENGQHVTVRIARYPDLIYRVRDEQLEFSGGSYEIRAEGIDK